MPKEIGSASWHPISNSRMSSRTAPAANLFPLLLAGLLAGMAFWLEQASRPQLSGNDGKLRHDPDYTIENFQLRRFDTSGTLQHTLLGDLMRHFPDDDSTAVTRPRLTYHRDPTTYATAKEALVDGKGEHVQLIDDVYVTRGGKPGKPDTVIVTQKLDAFPDEEIVVSKVPVTIIQGQTQIKGSGLSANNKTSLYVLEGPVQGVFVRNKGTIPSLQRSFPADSISSESSSPPRLILPGPQTKPKPVSRTKTKPQSRPQAKPEARQKSRPAAKAVR